MIEVRTFDGEPAELARFCTDVCKDRYRGTAVPIWLLSSSFLEWELFSNEDGARDFLLAAYDKGRLVGAMPLKPVRFHWRGQPVAGTTGAFFAIDRAYESEAVSLKLLLELRRRHRERHVPLSMGYVFLGARAALGKEFWLRLKALQIVAKLGLWIRMIDHRALVEYSFSRRDRVASRVMGWFQKRPQPPRDSNGIRSYREADLPGCLVLANILSVQAEFGLVWDESSLSRQLSFRNVPRTIVALHQGRVVGFVNYSLQEFLGRCTIRIACIDLLSLSELSPARGRDLLGAALANMAADGCHAAIMLRFPGQPVRILSQAGFIPEPADHYYVSQMTSPDAPQVKTRRIHALFR